MPAAHPYPRYLQQRQSPHAASGATRTHAATPSCLPLEQDVPGCEDVVPGCRGGVTYFVPSDTAFDSLFAAFDAETAQASGAGLL